MSPISPPQQNPHFPQTSNPQLSQFPPQMLPPVQQFPWKPFTIATNDATISSGFPYHQQLFTLQVPHDEWHQFTSEIVKAAKVSASDDAAAWTTRVGAALVLAPTLGYLAGKALHKKTVIRKAKERMKENGDIRIVLNRWNQATFNRRGFRCWLEFPMDGAEATKADKKEAQKFKIVIMPISETDELWSAASSSPSEPGLVPQSSVGFETEPFKGSYSPGVADPSGQIPTAELDGQSSPHESRPMIFELDGSG